MKIMRKPLAMLLVLFMLISMVPINSFAASNAAGTEATVAEAEGTENDFMKVFHLDCGRKFFTVDQVKELIDSLSEVGFSHMELAIGNDGLRLLLDDMSISANGTTYSSETVKEGIKAGNASYSHSGEWSQAEMDTIISYAATKGIEIIPLVNNPGHMDSILAAMKKCGIDGYYKSSARTVDLENAAAVAFTQALVMKYANYFAGKGCKYFNIGADEYANDYHTSDSTGMGFGYLIDNNKYGNFITYINTLVENICDLGMTPIAFNDGIYYNSTTSQGTFDTRLVVAAWTGGWGGIKPASTTFLAGKGHQILNTNERWYYVPSVSSGYTYNKALSNAQSVSVTTVTDNTGATPMGAMQCVWFDYPNVDYETYKSNVKTLIKTLAENNPTYFTGPNEPLTPEDVTKTDEATKIAVTAPGLTGLTVTEVKAPDIEAAAQGKVLAWDITPATDDGKYVGEAEVSVPVPADWTKVRGGVLASDNGEEVTGIKGKLENGMFTFTIPHFSNVVAYELDPAAIEADETVNLTVGGTSQEYTDYSGYYTVAEGLDTSIATATLGGNAGSAATVKYTEANVSCNDLIGSNSTSWKKTSYYYTPDNGKNYYPVYAMRSGNRTRTFTWGYSSTDSSNDVTQIRTQSVNRYSVSNTNPNITVYEKSGTEAVPAKTTVSFTGVSVGTTYATVGETTYKIVVSKKTETAIITVGSTKTYNDNSKTAPVVDDPSVADAVIENGNLTITAKVIGKTTITTDTAIYTINVVEFDPSKVTPLEIEYWITNHPVIPDGQDVNTSNVDHNGATQTNAQRIWINIPVKGDIYSETGEELKNLVAASGVDAHMTGNNVVFWKGVSLNIEENQQTTEKNDNESYNGTAFTRVRYWNDTWQVSSGSSWIDVSDKTQLVAYYLQKTVVTNLDVVQTEVVDWGEVYGESSYSDTNFVAMDFAIKYEDGTRNPNSFAVDGKTLMFHCDYNNALNETVFRDNNNKYYRRIGTIRATETSNYEVYMITITPNSDNVDTEAASNAGRLGNINYAGTEKVVWVDDKENLGIFEDSSLQHADFTEGGEPTIQKVDIYNQQAMLVTYYVRAKVTPDSLTVHYIDEAAGNVQFYDYNIAVAQGTYFNKDVALPNPWKGNLVNGTVQTIDKNVKQTVSSDLETLPAVAAQYLYSEYKCTHIELKYTTITNEDGSTASVPKDLFLYYTFNPTVTFVADFGLPIEITATDLNPKLEGIVSDMAVTGGSYTAYGQIVDSGASIQYKPTKIMQGSDFFTVLVKTTEASGILDDTAKQIAFRVYVVPATTVLYEETFINYDSNWTVPNAPTKMQATEVLGESSYYGFDSAYDGVKEPEIGSNATYAESKATGAAANFTFTGTGFELYANSKPASGFVTVYSQGELSKLYMINTKLTDVNGGEMSENSTYYSLPVISETDLPHGTYTVQIKQTNGEKPIYVDGVRIVNTIDETGKTAAESVYYNDEEDKPVFYEIRDYVLNAIGVENLTESDYIASGDRDSKVKAVKGMAGQVYNALGDGTKAVIIDKEITFGDEQAQNLLDNGPKNEVYLYSGQTLAFSVNTNRVMQLGLKAPTGSAKFELVVDGETLDLKSLSTTVDMFYKLAEKDVTEDKTHTVSVKVSEGVLSVTDLKICDDPTATFNDLTEKDIEDVLLGIYGLGEEPETPDDPENPGTPETPVVPEEPGTPETPVVPEEPGTPDEPTQEPEHECTMKEMIQPATTTKNGKVINKCKECGEVESTKIIYKASNVKLGQATFVYNGKAKNPKVIVKDSKGNTIAQKYYTVVKPTGRTNVGKYTYTIKFKGHYQGMKKLTLTVKPKATAVKTVTPSKKAFTVKWNKVSKQATGYEIMYATNAKFSKGKHTVTVKNFKTTSKKISNLKAKQKYYVKVRTYKTVKVNGKMTKIYSNWSKYRTVTTKR